MNENIEKMQKNICLWAVIIFLLSNIVGVLAIPSQQDLFPSTSKKILESHLNGLLGCFWLLGIAFTFRWINLSAKSAGMLVGNAKIAACALLALPLISAFNTGVSAIVFFSIFIVLVVVPTIFSGILWIRGLSGN
tara:strand:- start:290 stop:694 length:405 start_codon:yes stop_codon:yes gene_type:complete